VTIVRNTACAAALTLALSTPASFAEPAPAVDCETEASALSKQQSELPRLDVASPADRPPYCITLETNMAFALRVKAHLAHCPSSDYAAAVGDWIKTQADYSKLFRRQRCKRTM
jgi:hypothetical protein